jgi:hypothetical protein
MEEGSVSFMGNERYAASWKLTSWTTPLSDRSRTVGYQLKRWRSHNANRGRANR